MRVEVTDLVGGGWGVQTTFLLPRSKLHSQNLSPSLFWTLSNKRMASSTADSASKSVLLSLVSRLQEGSSNTITNLVGDTFHQQQILKVLVHLREKHDKTVLAEVLNQLRGIDIEQISILNDNVKDHDLAAITEELELFHGDGNKVIKECMDLAKKFPVEPLILYLRNMHPGAIVTLKVCHPIFLVSLSRFSSISFTHCS